MSDGTQEESNARTADVWTRAEAAAGACASPAWACRTSEVDACLAREALLPVRVTHGAATRTAALPLWLIAALARAAETDATRLTITLESSANNASSASASASGCRTLAVYSERAMGMLRADPHALSLGPLPAFYAVGAAVAAAAGTPARAETLRDAAAARLERIGVAASSIDAADVGAVAQLLAQPEQTLFDAVRADTVALDDWREQRPLRISPSAYVTAARDAAVPAAPSASSAKRSRIV